MNLNYSLNLNQSQKLILTKELRQSLDMLNMNNYELEEVIAKEGQENPVIEIEKKQDIDWEKYINYIGKGNNIDKEYIKYEDEDYNIENMVKYTISLSDHLKEQISCCRLNKENRRIVEYIIDCIDEDGYFRIEIDEICNELNVSTDNALEALKIVQSLEPSGVGSRNLQECLMIQLKEKGIDTKLLENVIKEDLNLIANKKYKDMSKKYKIKLEECIEIHEIIKTLEPRPGRQYSSFKNNYIIPDVFVEKVGKEFIVYLNEKNIPSVKINNFYKEVIQNTKDDKEAKEYIKEKLNSAINLIKNIESRKTTILKIANEILKEQIDFFKKGTNHLKPMILKDIAESLGFHESTVSRGVNGKYMLTPYGVFELKYFFSSGLKNSEDIASTSIKNIIKEIINSEDKRKPYSDEKICSLLKEKDINISRRTVAKYREEIGIEGSSKRKNY